MENRIKKSVGTLLAHIIKVDDRDVEKEVPLFCKIMGENFDCNPDEAKELLTTVLKEEYNLDEHIDTISIALEEDKLSRYHLMEQLNHIIFSDTITADDYQVFEKIKNRLFPGD